jgi:hypothetical protein
MTARRICTGNTKRNHRCAVAIKHGDIRFPNVFARLSRVEYAETIRRRGRHLFDVVNPDQTRQDPVRNVGEGVGIYAIWSRRSITACLGYVSGGIPGA